MEEMQVEKSEKKGKKDQAGKGKGSKRSHDILITSLGIKFFYNYLNSANIFFFNILIYFGSIAYMSIVFFC